MIDYSALDKTILVIAVVFALRFLTVIGNILRDNYRAQISLQHHYEHQLNAQTKSHSN